MEFGTQAFFDRLKAGVILPATRTSTTTWTHTVDRSVGHTWSALQDPRLRTSDDVLQDIKITRSGGG